MVLFGVVQSAGMELCCHDRVSCKRTGYCFPVNFKTMGMLENAVLKRKILSEFFFFSVLSKFTGRPVFEGKSVHM